jgi:hypothetical protein
MFMNKKIFVILLSAAAFLAPVLVSAQSSSGSQSESDNGAVKEFFRTLLFCGPGNRMCDKEYNPNVKNAMVESPEQLINFFTEFDNFMQGRRDAVSKQKPADRSASTPYKESKSTIAVTAAPPNKINPPLDNDAFQKLLKGNASLGSTIQGYIQKKPDSIPSLKIYAEGGDPFAQLFFGLAYSDEWTGMLNQAESCRWIKEAATAGVSSARYFIAQRAYSRSACFSEQPTLEQAKIWAELASQSNDQSIKKDSQELMLLILKAQIAGGK